MSVDDESWAMQEGSYLIRITHVNIDNIDWVMTVVGVVEAPLTEQNLRVDIPVALTGPEQDAFQAAVDAPDGLLTGRRFIARQTHVTRADDRVIWEWSDFRAVTPTAIAALYAEDVQVMLDLLAATIVVAREAAHAAAQHGAVDAWWLVEEALKPAKPAVATAISAIALDVETPAPVAAVTAPSPASDEHVLVHADGGACHGRILGPDGCPGCGIVPDMQSTEFWRRSQARP